MVFRTPDEFPGPSIDSEYRITGPDYDIDEDDYGVLTFGADGYFVLEDLFGPFNPRSGESVDYVTEEEHRTLRQLIHFIETNSPGPGFGDGPYASEVLPAADPFPTSETWFKTAGDRTAGTGKICRWEATYNANKTFATEKWIVYKADGLNPAADATDTISYSGTFETGRSRAYTVY